MSQGTPTPPPPGWSRRSAFPAMPEVPTFFINGQGTSFWASLATLMEELFPQGGTSGCRMPILLSFVIIIPFSFSFFLSFFIPPDETPLIDMQWCDLGT